MKLFKRELKASKKDATLPNTRKELFKLIFKEDFAFIVDSSLIQFLFSLPLIVCLTMMIMLLTAKGQNDIEYITPIVFWGSIISIPAFIIKYIGRIGLFGVTKQRVQNEGEVFSVILFKSIKENLLKSVFIGLLVGIGFFAGVVGSIFFLIRTNNPYSKGMGIGISIIAYFLTYMIAEYSCSIANFYDLNIFQTIKNAISFMFIDFLISLTYFVVMVIIPFAITLFANFAFYILLLIYALLIGGLSIIFITLRSHHLFDKYINSNYYPEIVNKGLNKKED